MKLNGRKLLYGRNIFQSSTIKYFYTNLDMEFYSLETLIAKNLYYLLCYYVLIIASIASKK